MAVEKPGKLLPGVGVGSRELGDVARGVGLSSAQFPCTARCVVCPSVSRRSQSLMMMMRGSKADPIVVDDPDDEGDDGIVDLTVDEAVKGPADVNESSPVEQAATKRGGRSAAAVKFVRKGELSLALTTTGAATVTPSKKRKTKHRQRRADWDAEDLETDSDDASYV